MATIRKTLTLDEGLTGRLAEQSRIEDRPMSRIVGKALLAYFETADRTGQ